jgi:hypothetical protein
MNLLEEEAIAVTHQAAPPPSPPVMADVAIPAIQLPGVTLKSISPAAEGNRDMEHLMGVGGDRPSAEAKAADDIARTGSITGLTVGQKAGDVVQASQQAAANAQLQASIAPSAAPDAPVVASLASLKDAVAAAISGMKDGAKEMVGTAQHVPEVALGTGTTPPAAAVSQPAVQEQKATAIGIG